MSDASVERRRGIAELTAGVGSLVIAGIAMVVQGDDESFPRGPAFRLEETNVAVMSCVVALCAGFVIGLAISRLFAGAPTTRYRWVLPAAVGLLIAQALVVVLASTTTTF